MGFADQVSAHTEQYRRRLKFIARTAVQEMGIEASIPVAQGGRMPVDTSFLRSSLLASTDGPPIGPAQGDKPIQGDPLPVMLIKWDPLTQTVWIGWTADYATIQNLRNGYRDGAVEKWPDFVRKATALGKRKKL